MHARIPTTLETIQNARLHANKKLGQHFLTDEMLLSSIVRCAALPMGVHAIEIGSGPGGLTRALLAEDHVAHLTAIELDVRCVVALQPLMEHYPQRFTLHQRDALDVRLHDLTPAPRAVVANLPYNVGTTLIIHWLKEIATYGADVVDSITVMLQKEVVERMVARPDSADYGRFSILCQWLCEVDYCMDVPPEAFTPPPAVMSSVVRLVPRAQPAFAASWEEVEAFTHAAFAQRRKMLRKNLLAWRSDAVERMEACSIDPTRRAETLTQKEIATLLIK
ncbi:MAG: 16S rRNA (adenine(1518)-N(6)/adenine(1519)-N(6))-dimethyltransferase RsmA [Alphaproteobacteria bacterium]|nr:MAG: 16S rRNA (adenine(1518)-N(6)/adenine(1519)-N(6))-dimethyltransferase RsmA [Alphaproteobacteria bacterium]